MVWDRATSTSSRLGDANSAEKETTMLEDTSCCDVTKNVALLKPPFWICARHARDGWIQTEDLWSQPCLDQLFMSKCGCVRYFLSGRSVRKCAKHTVGPMACCEQATRLSCVCVYAYDCPVHGEHHIGSHD